MASNTMPRPARNAAAIATSVALWALQLGAAYEFLKAGSAKLSGAPMMVGVFQAIGLGQWFRYFTGGAEVLGAIGLLIPFLSGYAAAALAAVMVGAVLTHLLVLGGSPALAGALLAAMILVAWARLGRKRV